jgi:hypothetical protein
VKYGFFDGSPGVLRMSTALRRAREQNMPPEVAETVQRIYREHDTCPTHGKLEDPIVGTVAPDQIAIVCPWCSDPQVLAAWEAEGKQALA